jgi:hypothetical protein
MLFLTNLAIRLGIPQKFAGLAVYGLLAILLALAYWRVNDTAYDRGETDGKKIVQDKWDDDKLQWAKKLAGKEAEYRTKEAALVAAAAADKQEGDRREARIAAQYDRAVNELRRERNARPGGDGRTPAVSLDPATGKPGTCTGGDLYAEDAVAFTGYAAEVERLSKDYAMCWNAYNRARAINNRQ